MSFVSQYNQIKANNDVKGIEIIIAAKNDDFLAISETITMIIALITVLKIKYIFLYDYLLQNK
tara:strand:- start:285 stop:473 length:189 start_codon:yes stop_codon:yes gene_type:complete